MDGLVLVDKKVLQSLSLQFFQKIDALEKEIKFAKGFYNFNIDPDIENGETPTTTPIFSLAAKRGVTLDVWSNIIDSGYNLTTTIDGASNENYTFGYYNDQWYWESGYYLPNSYSAEYYRSRNAWRYAARKGVPFVQFEFSKS